MCIKMFIIYYIVKNNYLNNTTKIFENVTVKKYVIKAHFEPYICSEFQTHLVF